MLIDYPYWLYSKDFASLMCSPRFSAFLKVGRCSLRSLDYPENLPASCGEIVVPILPRAVKGKPSVLRTLDSGRLSTKGILSRPEEWPRNRYIAI
jgi:hypothetical protein